MTPKTSTYRPEDVAVIGMSGRFPGAAGVEAFWKNLRAGVVSISFFTDEDLAGAGVDVELARQPAYVRAGGVIDDVDLFDASLFGLTPHEAAIMDPQQRLFLECAWEVLERSGYDPTSVPDRVGVYAGVNLSTYFIHHILPAADRHNGMELFESLLGNNKDFLATQVSYRLNLDGPSLSVQTACSTSLAAVHLACQSLLAGECDVALAGGVSINIPQKVGYLYQEGGIFSPDGYCRPFDAGAQGTVRGEGVGIVALKRLGDAVRDGDDVHAVIKGTALNNDGASKVGYTAPSEDGQALVISEALAVAEVDPDTVTYVEAHGTATRLGDAVEVAALQRAFDGKRRSGAYCALGSVKANVGHLDAASGVAGFIKAVLALRRRQIPPNPLFERPNPEIDFKGSAFYVNDALVEWKGNGAPLRAGVSSFGIGGTNAHVVLEEAPFRERGTSVREHGTSSRRARLLFVSASTPEALQETSTQLAAHLKRHDDADLADVAYTLHVGRPLLPYRRAVVGEKHLDVVGLLESSESVSQMARAGRPVAYLFPGIGADYAGMGRELYETERAYREAIDRCADFLKSAHDVDVGELLFSDRDDESSDRRTPPSIALPALFAVEQALVALLTSWGIRPAAMIGHSFGEYAAAHAAGVLSLEDALALVVHRGRLFESLQDGSMLSVALSEAELGDLLGDELSIAAINAPGISVVSGPTAAIEAFERRLDADGVEYVRLRVDTATHSHLVEPILEEFSHHVRRVALHPPEIPYVSCVTGGWITASEATDPVYWTRHVRCTVRYAEALDMLLADPDVSLLEVGPGHALSTLASMHPRCGPDRLVAAAMRHARDPQHDDVFLLRSLARMWTTGVDVSGASMYAGERRRRVTLPAHAFARRRYWIDPPAKRHPRDETKSADASHWFYAPSWKRSASPVGPGRDDRRDERWLVFVCEHGPGRVLEERLRSSGADVTTVAMGERYERVDEERFVLSPSDRQGYDRLLKALRRSGGIPRNVVHLWSMSGGVHGSTSATASPPASAFLELQLSRGFRSLLFFAQALHGQAAPVDLTVISDHLFDVSGLETTLPEKAPMLGLCKVIPQEYMNLSCRIVDVAIAPRLECSDERMAERLLREMESGGADDAVAIRGRERWVPTFDPIRLDGPDARRPPLRSKGVYLITGGLGIVGMRVARFLARTVQARLVLVGRTPLPSRDRWQEHLRGADACAPAIRHLLDLEEAGADVMYVSCDVTDERQLREAVARAEDRFGRLHGVCHAAAVTSGTAISREIAETTEADVSAQFEPKVHGVYTLDRVLGDRPLDFCMLFSSIASVLGGVGLAAYSAANAFMDAFAEHRWKRGDEAWISVSWDVWEDAQPSDGVRRTTVDEFAMSTAHALEAFRRIVLYADRPHVVISTGSFESRLRTWLGPSVAGPQRASRDAALHPRPMLSTPYVAPRSDVERRIADQLTQLLGIGPLGVEDNLFDLGAHSLMAVQLVSRVRDEFGVELPLRSFFEQPTVSGLALAVVQQKAAGTDEAVLTQLLSDLERDAIGRPTSD